MGGSKRFVLAAGCLLAGSLGWRSVFLLNVALVVVVAALTV